MDASQNPHIHNVIEASLISAFLPALLRAAPSPDFSNPEARGVF